MTLRARIAAGAVLGLLIAAVTAAGLIVSYTEECPPPGTVAVVEDGFRALTYRCYGSPDILELVRLEKPSPQGNEVLVRIKAASVNPLDWHYMRGSPYLMRLESGLGVPDNIRLGVDFAGVVESIGPDADRLRPGDRVFGAADGAFAEYVIVTEDQAVARIPDEVSMEQAASLPIAAVTALQALRDKGRLQATQKVLINGASGGVGTFAVQLAKAMGAEVHGVCSTRNVELVRSLGADRVFDYRREDYTESGETYDVIVDMVGNHSVATNRRVLQPDGRLVLVGGPKGDWLAPLIRPAGALLQSAITSQELLPMLARLHRADLETLAGFVAGGELQPVLDYSFSLDEAVDAIRYSETGRARGKILIRVD